MKIEARYVISLLKRVSETTKISLEFSRFDTMADKIDNEAVTAKYLYEHLYRKAKKCAHETEIISVKDDTVDAIAQYLKFDHMQHFMDVLDHPLDPVLASMEGNYYSYVRRNDNIGVLLRSPVRIFRNNNRMEFELIGGTWTYKGELRLSNGALFVLLKAESGKEIHHAYKIGKREIPQVLQGIFSGISTVSEPIGGRVVLIRESSQEEQHTKELVIADLRKSDDQTEVALAHYFSAFQDNNLSILKVTTFTIDDLIRKE